MTQTRRLAAILAADVAGYSRLIRADEGGTLKRLTGATASEPPGALLSAGALYDKTMNVGLRRAGFPDEWRNLDVSSGGRSLP